MVIIRTSAVAAIIQAVSPASILLGRRLRQAGEAAIAAERHGANAADAASDVVMSAPRDKFRRSQRVRIGLAGADAHRVVDAGDEDLAVADLAGLGRTR